MKANGILFHDHHLRVDKAARASSKDVDPRQSIFIGNLAFCKSCSLDVKSIPVYLMKISESSNEVSHFI